jgi:type I restriction enzyme M protein
MDATGFPIRSHHQPFFSLIAIEPPVPVSASPKIQKRVGTVANAGVVGVDEAKLWSMADALRNNMDAAEYKHVVLGLIFLKYISDAFEAKHAELESQRNQGADPEDPIEAALNRCHR